MENSVVCILYSYLAAESFDNFCVLIAKSEAQLFWKLI